MASIRNYAAVVGTTAVTMVIGQGADRFRSITISPRTTSVDVTARFQGSSGITSDAFTIPAGRTLTLQEPGDLLDVQTVILTAGSSITIDVLVALP